MLKLDKLVKTYKTGDQALKAVDIEIPKGQVLALIGPSGAGKSTLIRCINRLVEPTSGQVYLNDVELTCLSTSALRRERRRMGMIFQEYALIERLTVMENVLSGRLGYVGFWRSFLRNFHKVMLMRHTDYLIELVSQRWQISALMNFLEGKGKE